jgi:hypothetical protein
VGAILGYSPAMIGRYLNGTAGISSDFLLSINKNFPELDLNDVFAINEDGPNSVNEPSERYSKTTILTDIGEIEMQLQRVKEKLIQKGFD